MKIVWNYIVVIAAQTCEYSNTTEFYTLKCWILWDVNYISIKNNNIEVTEITVILRSFKE